MLTLESLHVYPIKSCRGVDVDAAEVTARGLRYDRRWMLMDEGGQFLTQRTLPQMAQLAVAFDGDALRVERAGYGAVHVPLAPKPQPEVTVEVWGDRVVAWPVPEADGWFRRALGVPCRLVYMPDTAERAVDPAYRHAEAHEYVSFADGYPYLVVSTASLDALNARLGTPVPMARFRPNLVISGADVPHAEDAWTRLHIGDVAFVGAKLCARCVVITTDQQTGDRGKEPLKTLATYRRNDGKVYFGKQFLLGRGQAGTVRVGDTVTAG